MPFRDLLLMPSRGQQLHKHKIIIESLRLKKFSAQKQVLDKNKTAAHYENLKDRDDRTENSEKKLALERSYLDSHLHLMNMKTPFFGKKKKKKKSWDAHLTPQFFKPIRDKAGKGSLGTKHLLSHSAMSFFSEIWSEVVWVLGCSTCPSRFFQSIQTLTIRDCILHSWMSLSVLLHRS